MLGEHCRKAEQVYCVNLLLNLAPIQNGIGKGAFFLKITVYGLRELTVFSQSPLIGQRLHGCHLLTDRFYHLMVGQTVQGCDLCGGIF